MVSPNSRKHACNTAIGWLSGRSPPPVKILHNDENAPSGSFRKGRWVGVVMMNRDSERIPRRLPWGGFNCGSVWLLTRQNQVKYDPQNSGKADAA